jgi:hypothetical protein
MRVGILGSGLMGGKLGTLFARATRELDQDAVTFPVTNELARASAGWRYGRAFRGSYAWRAGQK